MLFELSSQLLRRPLASQRHVAAVAAWKRGVVGRRRSASMPDTTPTAPSVLVEVIVDCSRASGTLARDREVKERGGLRGQLQLDAGAARRGHV